MNRTISAFILAFVVGFALNASGWGGLQNSRGFAGLPIARGAGVAGSGGGSGGVDAGPAAVTYAMFELAPNSGYGMPGVCTYDAGMYVVIGADAGLIATSTTRSTTETCTMPAGRAVVGIPTGGLVNIPANVPVVELNSAGRKSVRVEQALTNVLLPAEDLTTTWTVFGYNNNVVDPTYNPVVTANFALSPRGDLTADRVRIHDCAAGNASQSDVQQVIDPGNVQSLYTMATPGAFDGGVHHFSLCNYSGGGASTRCTICNAYEDGGWSRCAQIESGVSSSAVVIGCNNLQSTYTGATNTGTEDVLIWGVNGVRMGSGQAFVTSYIPDSVASGAKAGDVVIADLGAGAPTGMLFSASSAVEQLWTVGTQPNAQQFVAPFILYSDASRAVTRGIFDYSFNTGVLPGAGNGIIFNCLVGSDTATTYGPTTMTYTTNAVVQQNVRTYCAADGGIVTGSYGTNNYGASPNFSANPGATWASARYLDFGGAGALTETNALNSGFCFDSNPALCNALYGVERVTLIGDSIVQGAYSTVAPQVTIDATTGGRTVTTNLATSGWTIDQCDTALRAQLTIMQDAGTTSVSRMMVQCGINSQAAPSDGGTAVTNVVSKLESMLLASQAAGVPTIGSTLTPDCLTAGSVAFVDSVNSQLRAWGPGVSIPIAETFRPLEGPADSGCMAAQYIGDDAGLHPNTAGTAIMAGVWVTYGSW